VSEQEGRLRTTAATTLAIVGLIGLAVGGVIRPLIERGNGVAPTVPWAASMTLAFLAAVLGGLAWTTYRTIHQHRRRIEPQRAVNLLVFGKASALAGAAVAGGYLGYALSWIDSADDAALPRERLVHSLVACAAAAAVMAGGLLLERACRVPGDGDEGESGEPGAEGGGVAPENHHG
jgi:xanthosine utilization system XapX-like protein